MEESRWNDRSQGRSPVLWSGPACSQDNYQTDASRCVSGGAGEPPGVQPDSHLRGGSSEKCSGLLSGCRYFSSAACWASLTDGRWQQLGSARPDRLQLHPRLLQAPRLRGSSGGSELFKTPERQLSAGSGPSAGALLPFHCTCELVQDRLSDGGQPRLHSLLFTAEGPRLQEGRKGGRKSARRDGKCSPSRAERCFQHSLNTTVPCVHSPRDHLLVFGVWLQQT